ncbi:MAG: hypothetical protein KGI50_00060 [Patescibacteria group bacterium]|nr:hypothetical protein [Patescibacteria group bacterium]MDE2438245.1 hypothetical protein [Patescibacteria group bacterium]
MREPPQGLIMYCMIPTRLRGERERARTLSRADGYAPTIPFDIGEFEDFEGGTIGRERTLQFMLHVLSFCDVVGLFGISEGTMIELNRAIALGKTVLLYPDFDPQWNAAYENLKHTYGDPLSHVRGTHHLIVFVGPRAVGKTFYMDRFIEKFPDLLRRIKTTTTRSPRNEKDHEYYSFVSQSEFNTKLAQGQFVEHDTYHGVSYGSTLLHIREVLSTHHGIYALTPGGVHAIWKRHHDINLTIITLLPASPEVLATHIKRRGIEDPHERIEDFLLPSSVPHYTILITGEDRKDESNLLEIIRPILASPL